MRRRTALASAVFLLGASACAEQGPESGPGTLTAVVASPEAAEGSGVVRLFGPGIGQVSGIDGPVFTQRRGDTVTVVVINEAGGPLRFSVALADTVQRPEGVVEQVAGVDDALRGAIQAYAVEWIR